MYAIQVGSKFAKVSYFLDPNKVWNVSLSDTPKIYKTKAAAQTEVERVIEWVEDCIVHAEGVIDSTSDSVAKHRKEVARLEAELETLLDLPFREVERKVKQIREAIARAKSNISCGTPSISSVKSDLTRYRKIKAAGARVVLLQQTVEAL